MSLLIPSYKSGFARNAAESENPNLWKGLIGLWAPSLGPTGLTLFDWSGFGNDATLTDMAPASDWVATEKSWALDFDATNDYVDCGDLDLTDAISVCAWIRMTNLASGPILVSKRNTNPGADYSWELGVDAPGGVDSKGLFFRINDNANIAESGDGGNGIYLSDGVWYYVVGTYDKANIKVYVDGVLGGSAAYAVAISTNNTPIAIARRFHTGAEAWYQGLVASVSIWSRALPLDESQQLYVDPHALLRLRRRVFATAVAPGLSIPVAMRHYLQIQGAG